jgi:hypothetical protein
MNRKEHLCALKNASKPALVFKEIWIAFKKMIRKQTPCYTTDAYGEGRIYYAFVANKEPQEVKRSLVAFLDTSVFYEKGKFDSVKAVEKFYIEHRELIAEAFLEVDGMYGPSRRHR